MHKILIGGQALAQLGSTRYAKETDYLVNLETSKERFIQGLNGILINANAYPFFKEIWELEKLNTMASPQSLFDLKCFAFTHHFINSNWQKVDDCEYDLKFLARKFGINTFCISVKYIPNIVAAEIQKIINSTKI